MKAVYPPPPEKSNFIYSSRMPFAIRDLNQLEIDHSKDSEILAMMRKMYPALGDQQLIEAKENLERYLKLAWRIADRIVKDSEKPPFDNTADNPYDTGTKVEKHTPLSLTQ